MFIGASPPFPPQRHPVYTPSCLPFPSWHGLTQTHFPPRRRQSAWHSGITSIVLPHGVRAQILHCKVASSEATAPRSCCRYTFTFISDDSYALWQSTVHLHFGRQLHTLATSTVILRRQLIMHFGKFYLCCGPLLHTLATSTK